MTKVNCNEESCKFNKNNTCQKEEITIGCFIPTDCISYEVVNDED